MLHGDSILRKGKRCIGRFAKRLGKTLHFLDSSCRGGDQFRGAWVTHARTVPRARECVKESA